MTTSTSHQLRRSSVESVADSIWRLTIIFLRRLVLVIPSNLAAFTRLPLVCFITKLNSFSSSSATACSYNWSVPIAICWSKNACKSQVFPNGCLLCCTLSIEWSASPEIDGVGSGVMFSCAFVLSRSKHLHWNWAGRIWPQKIQNFLREDKAAQTSVRRLTNFLSNDAIEKLWTSLISLAR